MNMDYYGYFSFGDADAVRQFSMAHYFAHEAEANAIAKQFGATISTYNSAGFGAVEPWIGLMDGTIEQVPPEMYDWLQIHNDNHQTMLAILAKNGSPVLTSVADLSLADFGNPEQMDDWLQYHQTLHRFEQTALGLV